MVTAAVARANVDDILLEGDRYVDKSALRSVYGYSVAIAVLILISFVVIITIRLLGIGVFNQFWIVFGIMVHPLAMSRCVYSYVLQSMYRTLLTVSSGLAIASFQLWLVE